MTKCAIIGDSLLHLFAEPLSSVIGLLARNRHGARTF